ncbi:hypothetical protein [Cellulomonas xylanilytica]|uniref:Integral membrane protein n=1 Tax=Cellulomonas xylanilytica TaxID=233583 RepID=A0A510UXZ2_9CELL|nr:hypothetical protein [Cellulomonas xylanilytica]GEK19518.1 hypothetical protein CXY01_00380 [Cellulomonas xylanilytica]
MSENPGGTPPRDDDPAKAAEPVEPVTRGGGPDGGSIEPPTTPDPVVPPAPDAPPVPPAPAAPTGPPAPPAPPAPSYGQPPAGPPPAPAYGQPPAGSSPYGQPAPGGYPPPPPPGYGQGPGGYPPAGGYGQAPPGAYPPPAGGYGAPVQASPIGEAYSYGWKKFTQSGGLFIGAALVWFIVAVVVFFVVAAIFGGFGALLDPDGDGVSNGIGFGLSFGFIVVSAAFAIVSYLIQAAFIRAALTVTEGRQLQFGDFFKFVDAGPIILTALLLAAIGVVLNLIPFFGGIVTIAVNFLLFFTFWFVIDKHLSPIDALKASYQLVTTNLSTTLLFYLLSIAIIFVGAILCGIGLLVAVPVVLLASAFLFKRLLGDPIAA